LRFTTGAAIVPSWTGYAPFAARQAGAAEKEQMPAKAPMVPL